MQKIGNWLITEEGIKWDGTPKRNYPLIPKDRLIEVGTDERKTMYDWLVHMQGKDWITKEDLYALNTAFVFALEYFKIGFPSNISFVDTFKEQQKVIKEEKEDIHFE